MKLLRYGPKGAEKPGMLDAGGRIRDLSGVIPDLADGALSRGSLGRLAELDPESLPPVAPGTRLGPCIARVGNFIGIGLNYADHAAETGAEPPTEPILFNKAPSSLAGPDDDLPVPPGATKVDWEVELAVVIGTAGYRIAEADARAHIAGFCICNDVSERAFQMERLGTWSKGKGLPGFGPLGPWLVTPDEVPEPQDLGLWLSLNGTRVQDGTTRTMIFGVDHLVHYVSQFMELRPGDVITTGTPPGVGMGLTPQRFLAPGDVVELGITGLGQQRQQVVAG